METGRRGFLGALLSAPFVARAVMPPGTPVAAPRPISAYRTPDGRILAYRRASMDLLRGEIDFENGKMAGVSEALIIRRGEYGWFQVYGPARVLLESQPH